MYKIDSLCFSVSNILIEDDNTEEYELDKRCIFTLHANTDTPLTVSTNTNVFIKHLKNNIYEIQGYVYESKCDYALININGIRLSICNQDVRYKEKHTYHGIVSLTYDVWSCYEMNVCSDYNDENLYFEGITKNIKLVISESNYRTLSKTNSFYDAPNGIHHYLITVALCSDKIMQQEESPVLQISKDKLVLNLKEISDYKVKLIKEYIQKVCKL